MVETKLKSPREERDGRREGDDPIEERGGLEEKERKIHDRM